MSYKSARTYDLNGIYRDHEAKLAVQRGVFGESMNRLGANVEVAAKIGEVAVIEQPRASLSSVVVGTEVQQIPSQVAALSPSENLPHAA
jgi:hypothetical protein